MSIASKINSRINYKRACEIVRLGRGKISLDEAKKMVAKEQAIREAHYLETARLRSIRRDEINEFAPEA